MNKQIWTIIIVAILIIFGGWYYLTSKPTPATGEPIKIGGAFGLSGFAAAWGEAERNAATLAIEEINKQGGVDGRQLVLISEDTASSPTKTVSAVNKLIDIDQVDVILGPSWLDSYQGAAPIADRKNIVMLTSSASITAVQGYGEPKYDNVFSTWYRTDQETEQLLEYLSDAGQTRIALFFQNDPFWVDLQSFIKQNLPDDLQIVSEMNFHSEEIDFRTYLQKLKQEDPDAIIFGLNSERANSAFLNQRQNIYPESTLYTTEWIEELATQPEIARLLNNTFFIAPSVPDQNFIEKYIDRFGVDPVFSASNAYDAIYILAEAVEESGLDSDSIKDYLRNNEFDTVSFGRMTFDDIGGVVGGDFVIKEIIDGGVRIVE